MGKKWTEEETKYLVENYGKIEKEELIRHLNRTWTAITLKAQKLGLKVKERWTKKEDAYLEKHYATETKEKIMKNLPKRSWCAIVVRAEQKGLRREIGLVTEGGEAKRGRNAQYKVDTDFFKSTRGSTLYVLGRLITDGHWRLRKTGGNVTIKSIDKENLEKIRFVMKSTHKILKEKTENGTWIYLFTIYSNEIVKDVQNRLQNLSELGKSPDFLRGVIDGDGTITINKKGYLSVSLRNSNLNLLTEIQKYWGGSIVNNKTGKYRDLYWGGDSAERLLQQIYGKTMPFLCIARKYSRWQLYQAMKGLLNVT